MKIIIIALVYVFTFSACSDKASEAEECPIAGDSVFILDHLQQEGRTYYLVYRIAGWHDKTEILELYDGKPEFDKCSRSIIKPIYSASLEMTQTVKHVYLNVKAGELDIQYKDAAPGRDSVSLLKLELAP